MNGKEAVIEGATLDYYNLYANPKMKPSFRQRYT